jgi:hypothetical protein
MHVFGQTNGEDSIYQSSADEWHRDVLLAKSAVEDTISKMPTPLRVEGCCVGYQFWKISDDPRFPDTLGDYCRSVRQIRLFLPNIRSNVVRMAMSSPEKWLPLTFTSLVIIWARKVTWKPGDCRANAGERFGKTPTITPAAERSQFRLADHALSLPGYFSL